MSLVKINQFCCIQLPIYNMAQAQSSHQSFPNFGYGPDQIPHVFIEASLLTTLILLKNFRSLLMLLHVLICKENILSNLLCDSFRCLTRLLNRTFTTLFTVKLSFHRYCVLTWTCWMFLHILVQDMFLSNFCYVIIFNIWLLVNVHIKFYDTIKFINYFKFICVHFYIIFYTYIQF